MGVGGSFPSHAFAHFAVIMLTAYGTTDSAIAAMKHGAYDYLLKPAPLEAIELALEPGGERPRRDPVPRRDRRAAVGGPLPGLQLAERQAIGAAVESAGGNVSEAARRLGLGRFALLYRMRKHGLSAGHPDLSPPPSIRDPTELHEEPCSPLE